MGRKRKFTASHEPSALYLLLMRDFALGKASAAQVQKTADAAVKSGADKEDLLILQALGVNGFSGQNCHRDMMRLPIFQQMKTPQLTYVTTDAQVRAADGQLKAQAEDIPLLLPHLWIESLDELLGLFMVSFSYFLKPSQFAYVSKSSSTFFGHP